MIIRPRKNQTNKGRSKKSEKRAVKILGGKVQPASGALNVLSMKADIKTDLFLVDDKTTTRPSYSLALKMWRKLSCQAWGNNRAPMLRLEFTPGPSLYVIDEMTLLKLVKAANLKTLVDHI